MKRAPILCLLSLVWMTSLLPLPGLAQTEIRNRPGSDYIFTPEIDLEASAVRNQYRSGTCWCFSTLSFLESELMRMGKGEHDLSEMYVVRQVYLAKMDRYVRMHGSSTLGPGGTFHDVWTTWHTAGIVPEGVYSGLGVDPAGHNHGELDALMVRMGKALVAEGHPSPRWRAAVAGVLDAYLGAVPAEFVWEGKTYTPQSYARQLGLDPSDYLEFTSFTHMPYYEQGLLDIPDNWDGRRMYNLPLDELVAVVDHALESGYTVGWDADVSEPTFSHGNGLAIVPAQDWSSLDAAAREALFVRPAPEKVIDAALRQVSFDNYATTDDHLMHITGRVRDRNNQPYYITKNSWGTSNACGGYLYVSQPYLRYKTIHILVHRDAVPRETLRKLK